jgi:hypothetical protein
VQGRCAFRLAGISLAAVAVLAASATAGDLGRKIGQGSASGEFAIALAEGSAKKPRELFVKVVTSPSQYVDGAYTVVCTKGQGAGTADELFGGEAPLVEPLKHPYKHPDRCEVAADAQLAESGAVTVKLFARRKP